MMIRILSGAFLLFTVYTVSRGAAVSGDPSQDCPFPCTQHGHQYCHPLPCYRESCTVDYVTTPGECCPHCPNVTDSTSNNCPNPCTQGGHKYCHPIPCPHPPCDHPVTTPGECCPHCESVAVGKRDDHDCPNPCTQGGQKYCHPIPCPHPPCDHPVTTPGECCPHCGNRTGGNAVGNSSCPHPCEINGHHFCHPIPCPMPPCTDPVTLPGQCCGTCPGESVAVGKRDDHDCPNPCTQGGQKYCHPIPCPHPPCDHPVTTPGECCPHCGNRTECPHSCKINGKAYCHSPGCPPPEPCRKSVLTPGDCCPHCESEGGNAVGNSSCPHPCEINGHHFCHPIPCPMPPCTDPVTLPGQCCGSCPGESVAVGKRDDHDCPHPCEVNGNHFCFQPPCPPPPCADPVTLPGQCCGSCPGGNKEKDNRVWPDPWKCYPPPPCPPPPPPPYCNATIIEPYDLCCEVCETACPNRCRVFDAIWCHPPACPSLPCSDAKWTEGDCCPHCEADHGHL